MGLHLIKTANGTVLSGHTAIAPYPFPADKITGAGHKNAGDAYGKKDPRHNLRFVPNLTFRAELPLPIIISDYRI
jgi:hypothetical protein